jgi:predicted nucleic acid-binding protein
VSRSPTTDIAACARGSARGAWAARERLRLVDALYVELCAKLGARVLTADARLARALTTADLVTAP